MPKLSKRDIGLKILEIMLALGIAAGAFFYFQLTDKTNYLAYLSLFSAFGFTSYLLLQMNTKMNFWIFLLNMSTSVTFASVIGIPMMQFTEGSLHTFSIIFTIALMLLFIPLADSYKKIDRKRTRRKKK